MKYLLAIWLFAVSALADPMDFMPFMKAPAAQSEITEGLVGWWKLEEGSGDVFTDSWNGLTGTNFNVLYETARVGNFSGYYNGTNGYSQIASTNLTNMTFAAWVYPMNGGNSSGGIMAKYVDSANWSYRINWNGTLRRPIAYVRIGGTSYQSPALGSNTILQSNEWIHIAFRHNGIQLSVYTNGVYYATEAAPGSIQTSTAGVRFGAYATLYFLGRLDDVRLYNRALTLDEVYSVAGGTALTATNTTTLTNLVTDGDSITSGFGAEIGWPVVIATNVSGLSVSNIAVSGQSYSSMLSDPLQQARLFAPSAAANILVLWNSNDTVLGANTNTVFARISESIEYGASLGYDVWVGTLINRINYSTNAAWALDRTNINNWIVSNAVARGAAGVVNLATNAALDYTITPANFQADNIHPNASGSAAAADQFAEIIFGQ